MDRDTCIAIFVKSPDKGTVKTRLASVLDADTVVEIYCRFVLDVLGTISCSGFDSRIFFYPPESERNVAGWLGEKYCYTPQQGKDLGERMQNAFLAAFAEGFHKVVLIGTDFPDLPVDILGEAANALASKDAVIGPTMDGGYYLIGFNADRFPAEVFNDMEWGTSSVFERTLDVLSRCGFSVQVLQKWRDIDKYEDLTAFIKEHETTPAGRLLTLDYLRAKEKISTKEQYGISVIVPVLREEAVINTTVRALRRLAANHQLEIIVVDGDEEAKTLSVIEDAHVVKARSEKGRGKQMNAGARLATGEILLFLHADTELPQDSLARIVSIMSDGRCVGGSFDLGIRSDRRCFRLIEWAANLRSRITRVPYGDQAIFLRRDFFFDLGGFHDLPLMEDLDLMRRVRRRRARIEIIAEKVNTSPRRWEKEGILYCTWRNWTLTLLYMLGASPERLAKFYRDDSDIR